MDRHLVQRLFVVALVVLALAANAVGAHAGTLSRQGNTTRFGVTYTAGAGESNRVTVTRVSSMTVVEDTGAQVSAGSGCIRVNDHKAQCQTVSSSITMDLGDRNDVVESVAPRCLCDGEAGDDTLNGGSSADVLDGGPGNDQLRGAGGDDTLDGGTGGDRLTGGPGSDVLRGGTGGEPSGLINGFRVKFGDFVDYSDHPGGVTVNIADGLRNDGNADDGEARDLVATDVESVDGGAGPDVLTGSESENALSGGDGGDLLTGLGEVDLLDGGSGADTLSGGAGDDGLVGGTFNQIDTDSLAGGAGNDELKAGGGPDFLTGEDGDDLLAGGPGADVISGGANTAILDSGGPGGLDCIFCIETGIPLHSQGGDTVTYAEFIQGGGEVTIGGDGGLDGGPSDGPVGARDDVRSDVENITGGAGGAWTLVGSAVTNVLVGGTGADTLRGLGGDDLLIGGNGADVLDGGEHQIRDAVRYGDTTTPVTVNLTQTGAVQGGSQDGPARSRDTFAGIERADGTSQGDDNLTGDDGPNQLVGAGGEDTLTGGLGADVLFGGNAGDAIFSRDGVADTLSCGQGPETDTLDADLKDPIPTDCENVTQGAIREGANVRMSLNVSRSARTGQVTVRLTCPRSLTTRCAGALALATSLVRRGSAAKTSYRLQPGRARTATLTLARRELRRLRDAGSLRARVTSVETGSFGPKTTVRTVILRRSARKSS